MPVEAAGCTKEYTVVRGDTLSLIAQRLIGSVTDYTLLHEYNRDVIGPNPALLEVGQVLKVPCSRDELIEAAASTDTAKDTRDLDSGAPIAHANWSRLVDSADLEALRRAGGVQIVDIRRAQGVRKGFVPGAVSLPFGLWVGDSESASGLPEINRLAAHLGDAGVRMDAPVVLVAARNDVESMAQAAWAYWILKSAGARQVAILKGGFSEWAAGDRRVVQKATSQRRRPFQMTFSNTWLANAETVDRIGRGIEHGAILDGRARPVFDGVSPKDPLLVTPLPGAHRLPAEEAFARSQESGVLGEGILELLKGQPVAWEVERVVSVGLTGSMAALNWFFASEIAGIRQVQVFPGTVSDVFTASGIKPTASLD